jgi:DNA-binding SARP family transcriptional activator
VRSVVDHRPRPRPADPAPPVATPVTRLTLLGGFEASVDGELVRVPEAVARLVAFLALHGAAVPRPFAAGTLWPDTTDDRSLANLRSALWRLRRSAPALVDVDGPLRLRPAVQVDLAELGRLLGDLDHDAEPRVEALQEVLAARELLPGWYDEWVVVERERLRELRLRALQTLCERFTAAGRFGPAIDAGSAAVRDEPFRESAQRALIRAHLVEGNVGEALRQYRRYELLLGEELGLAPSREMRDLLDLVTTA